jgi:hypothetical protein
MHNGSEPARELTLELGEADEFFAGSEPNVAAGRPGLPPGIDQIREELEAGSLPDALATVIVLPGAQVKPGLSDDFARAVERYCAMGISKAENEIKHLRREGFRTLLIGLALFFVFVSIAEALVHTGLPTPVKNFLGEDGLFIVVGWVGLWYPIETLLYSHRPYRQEIAVLQLIRRMQIEVRPAGYLAQAPGQVRSE